ncbi:MAG: hypothetical protein KC503_10520 [Myxococcales bacterium]|nr:hypothetical protein [Myxococcales bacterium]
MAARSAAIDSSAVSARAELDARQADPSYDPLADAEPFERRPPSGRRRLVALIIALALAGISVLAATYSMFKGRPHPDQTRPLPRHVPRPGAVR